MDRSRFTPSGRKKPVLVQNEHLLSHLSHANRVMLVSEDKAMEFRIAGIGTVTLEELEARFFAYMNAGAPEPVLEGTPEEQKAILEQIASRGDSQMRALMNDYLKRATQG
jgi:hypothetical protein